MNFIGWIENEKDEGGEETGGNGNLTEGLNCVIYGYVRYFNWFSEL